VSSELIKKTIKSDLSKLCSPYNMTDNINYQIILKCDIPT